MYMLHFSLRLKRVTKRYRFSVLRLSSDVMSHPKRKTEAEVENGRQPTEMHGDKTPSRTI